VVDVEVEVHIQVGVDFVSEVRVDVRLVRQIDFLADVHDLAAFF